jgi:hypothetical protein
MGQLNQGEGGCVAGNCEHSNETSDCMKVRECLHKQSYYQLLKNSGQYIYFSSKLCKIACSRTKHSAIISNRLQEEPLVMTVTGPGWNFVFNGRTEFPVKKDTLMLQFTRALPVLGHTRKLESFQTYVMTGRNM